MPTDDLLTSREVADLLQCSIWTVGRLPANVLPVAVKAPGSRGARFYRRRDVEALIAKRSAA